MPILKTFFEDIGKITYHLELECLKHFPLSWSFRWLRIQGRVKYFIQGRRRKQSEHWMRRALPKGATEQQVQQGAQEHFVFNELRLYLKYLVLAHDARKFQYPIEVEGLERIDEALRRGNGVILLSSHVGLPRLLRWLFRSKDYRVLYLLKMMHPRNAKTIRDWLFFKLRARFRLDDDDMAGNEELSVQYLKRAYDFLRQNGVVNIAGDGPVGDRRTDVIICSHKRSLPLGGLALGVMNDAVILPVFTVIDTSPRFLIQIQEPLVIPQEANRSKQLDLLAAAYAERLENYVVEHPTNVYNMRHFP
ncbi:MAG: hypothetical protein P8J87_19560 [Verrucomicrobiales bacterium]|nr:hypothetical protein [Verrucomicrobiales bacterium]